MKPSLITTIILLALLLLGCGYQMPEATTEATETEVSTPTPAPSPKPTPTMDPTPAETGIPARSTKTHETETTETIKKRTKTKTTVSDSGPAYGGIVSDKWDHVSTAYWADYGSEYDVTSGFTGLDLTVLRLKKDQTYHTPPTMAIGLYEYDKGDYYYEVFYMDPGEGGVFYWSWNPFWDFFCEHTYRIDVPDTIWDTSATGSMTLSGTYIRDCGETFASSNEQKMLNFTLSPQEDLWYD